MIADGADLIDIGGESTRPGAKTVSIEEELKRVIPVIKQLSKETSTPLSVDTSKSIVAEQAIQAGATMVNDVTALRADPKLAEIITKYDTNISLMHMKGNPRTMQKNPTYEDIIEEIKYFLKQRINFAVNHGIPKNHILIDPGIGFGKRTGKGKEDNCSILHHLQEFNELHCPIIIGASRKRFIGNICTEKQPLPPSERLEGSLAAACAAALQGAGMVRVHDVKETRRCLNIIDCIKRDGDTIC
jgi:dihydropteroate synthase